MFTIRRARQGVTLIELMVACGLGLLLMTAAYQLLIPGLRTWAASNVRSHLRQNALSTLTRIAHDVKMTNIESVAVIPRTVPDADTGKDEPAATLTLMSPMDADGMLQQRADDGNVIWQKYVAFYLDTERHELMMGERPLQYDTEGGLYFRLEQFTPDPSRDRVIGRNVHGLDVDTAVDDFARDLGSSAFVRTNPVTLRIHLWDHREECWLETALSTLLTGDAASSAPQKTP